ncbi:hypothetical protein KZX46_12350 [Polymorphobacter sp. PAMC 29334]|uniref:hypothetical protein n=1 Tax=Polymorphobacter sp. PAMC 29334 TaxID=2862331 RepID=UPI001C74AD46|nr:hypothetical protein [Polymorphobacter sp. PAMC 29334]QYE36632.1 hypothetical protein KZX46_12350 [Polymorphobacter sp. PAMC 29334]
MADRKDPPISEALMALLAGAAPLFERAKASGLFRDRPIDVTPNTPSTPTPPTHDTPDAAQKSALQEIIVSQAMKIVALEAEVARLKAG